MAKKIIIGGRLESAEVGGIVAGANAVYDDTKAKTQNVINGETDAELQRLAESKQDNLTFDNSPTENSTNPVKSGGVWAADKALSDAIEAILLLIPSAATALNKLADMNYVNSSIATNTATFRGTSAAGLTEQQFIAWADSLTHDLNDYVFWQTVDAAGNTLFKRYKWNGTEWAYEYTLNNSSFTSAQWEAINSAITSVLVTKLTNLPDVTTLGGMFDAKQDVLTFDDAPTQGSSNPVKSGGVYTAVKGATDDISAINGKIPSEASPSNKLADMTWVAAQILAAVVEFKGQFTTLAELEAVLEPKAGDIGIVRTKDSDGYDVFTFYQYLSSQWNVFYILSRHPLNKPASTGATGDYKFNGLGCVELPMNIVNVGTELEPSYQNQLTQDMFYKGAVGSRVPNTNTIFVIKYDFTLTQDVTIPAGCVLKFEGGSISGAYTLTLSNTIIVGNPNITSLVGGTLEPSQKADITWFGAVEGDNTVDCSVAFGKACTVSNNIYVPNGDYYFANGIVIDYEHKDVVCDGNLYYNGNSAIDFITIGVAGQQMHAAHIVFNDIWNNGNASANGVVFVGYEKDSLFEFNRIRGFDKCFYVKGTFATNRINGGIIEGTADYHGVHIEPTNASDWVNDNRFFIKHIAVISASTAQSVKGIVFIAPQNAANVFNSNVFSNVSFELGGSNKENVAIVLDNCRYNRFENLRFEGVKYAAKSHNSLYNEINSVLCLAANKRVIPDDSKANKFTNLSTREIPYREITYKADSFTLVESLTVGGRYSADYLQYDPRLVITDDIIDQSRYTDKLTIMFDTKSIATEYLPEIEVFADYNTDCNLGVKALELNGVEITDYSELDFDYMNSYESYAIKDGDYMVTGDRPLEHIEVERKITKFLLRIVKPSTFKFITIRYRYCEPVKN